MSDDPLDRLRRFFGVDDDDAEELLMLTHWVDQQLASEKYGYPKDNLIPPPLEERLRDLDYLQCLLEAARDQEPRLIEVIADAIDGAGTKGRRT